VDESINTKKDTGENLASGEHVLTKMPSFGEYRAEIESGVENKEKINEEDGQKRNLGVEALEVVSTEQKLDPFWEKHPDLLKEAYELGAPLTVKEFKEQGYRFEKGSNDKYHILAPTPAYKEWQRSDDKETAFRGFAREDVRDKLKNDPKMLLDRFLHDKEKNETKSGVWDDLINDREVIEYVYSIWYPNTSEQAKNRHIDDIAESLRDFPSEDEMLERINTYLTHKYNVAFKKDNIPTGDGWINMARDKALGVAGDSVYVQGIYYSTNTEEALSKVAAIVAKMQVEKNLPQIDEQVGKNLDGVKERAVLWSLEDGKFFPKTFAENPVSVNAVFEELGVDKNSREVTISALLGYATGSNSTEKHKSEIQFFDLENKLADLLDSDINKDCRLIQSDGDSLEIADSKGWKWDEPWRTINPEVSKKAMEKIQTAEDNIIEKIKNNPDFEKLVEGARRKTIKSGKDRIAERVAKAKAKWQNLDIDQYLDTKMLEVNIDDNIRKFIDVNKNSEKFGRILSVERICDGLDIPGVNVGDEYKEAVREAFLKRLADGVSDVSGKEWWNESLYPDEFLTEIFETNDFKKNQSRIGIDFKDPEVADIAFGGFINTLGTLNGEASKQASWYYDNIFANDPDKFLGMIKSYRDDPNTGRGIKAKITRFFNNNPRAFEDKVRAIARERFQKEINNEKRAIRTSVLRNARRGTIEQIVDNYKDALVASVRAKNAEDVYTFIGKKTTNGAQYGVGTNSYKETPFDFGLEKGNALLKYGDFVENNFPDCNLKWFIDTFPGSKEFFDNQDSYVGFSFEYNGKLCVISESLSGEAAMYLWRGEIGEDLNDDFRQMFDLSRFDAKRTKDPRIVSVDHLDKEHFDDSIDETYQKAFMFFNSGDKREVTYKGFGGRSKWNEHRDDVLGAWPLSVEQDYRNYPEDLEKYHEWQQRQAEIQSRLKAAVEQGGQNAVKKELEKIAEEDYLAMYEGRR